MDNISLNASEWKIMEYLWSSSPQTLMQIVREMKETIGWSKSTVTTLLSRMEHKGAIYYKEGAKAREYYPAVTREAAAMEETRSLLSRVYRGSIGMMMNTLVEENSLTKEDIDGLYEILKKAEEKND